jgi:hypothetical protein
MKTSSALLLAVAALSSGFILGRVGPFAGGDSAPGRAKVESLERERDEALVRAAKAESEVLAQRRRRAELDAVAAAGEPAATSSSPSNGGAPAPSDGTATPTAQPGTPEARAADVKDLAAKIAPALEEGDGEKALELLRRLSSIVPEGREAAMDLAIRLNEDVSGAGALKLDQYTFYTSLGDTGVRELMVWALANPSPEKFRVLAAASLPWVLPKARAIEVLGAALGTEKDTQAQQSLVVSLSQMNDTRAHELLASVLADTTRTPELRAQVALSASGTASPEMTKALERAAGADANDSVRAAARAALAARNPPQDGFLLTTVYPDGAAAAAGLRAGDILLWYDGRATREVRDVRDAIEAPATSETAVVVVLREGQETTVTVRRGRLGIQGRAVKRK